MKDSKKSGGGKARRHAVEFKVRVVQRMMAGEPVARLSREVQVKRTLLYRWRDTYRKQGVAGFQQPVGRPRKEPAEVVPGAAARTGQPVSLPRYRQAERCVTSPLRPTPSIMTGEKILGNQQCARCYAQHRFTSKRRTLVPLGWQVEVL